MTDVHCPFHVGDKVRYEPISRQLGLEVMSSPEGLLVPGATYTVESIERGEYVVVQG